MTNKMNINVSGGTASIGAVSQGNATRVSGTASVTQAEAERCFRSAEQDVRALADALGKTNAEIEAVLERMTALKDGALNAPENAEEGADILKTIRENASWAYPAIKDFATAVWPVVLAAVGA